MRRLCVLPTEVVADNAARYNGAFAPNVQADIEFTQPGVVMKRDSLDRWRGARRLHTRAVALDGWDYRGSRPPNSWKRSGPP